MHNNNIIDVIRYVFDKNNTRVHDFIIFYYIFHDCVCAQGFSEEKYYYSSDIRYLASGPHLITSGVVVIRCTAAIRHYII